MDIRKEIVENRALAQKGEGEDSFVFPLVLPGDWQASPAQKERAKKGLFLPGTGEKASNASGNGTGNGESVGKGEGKPLNRLYVSPRSKEQGGGMTVRGAVRKGLTHLRDFQVGVLLADNTSESDGQEHKSKL